MKANIAIVDDNMINRTILRKVLQNDYNISTYESGYDLLSDAKGIKRFDLLLIDIVMPVITGYELVEQLHQYLEVNNIPFMFITVLDGVKDELKGFEMGAVDYIRKPFEPIVVKQRVKTQIDIKLYQDYMRRTNRKLHTTIQTQVDEIMMIQKLTTEMFADMIEFREGAITTSNHVRRIKDILEIFAGGVRKNPSLRQRLDEERWDVIVDASPLHDIGKIAIDRSILYKPGKLSNKERDIMYTHVEVGREIISNVINNLQEEDIGEHSRVHQFFHCALDMVSYHHERWNGNGYPFGLVGEDIPFIGRIMAIIDVFEVLLAKRSYKSSWNFDDAFSYIISRSGVDFDPQLIEVFKTLEKPFKNLLIIGEDDEQ